MSKTKAVVPHPGKAVHSLEFKFEPDSYNIVIDMR